MPIIGISPEQMQARVARFDKLKYPPNRYHDSQLPGHERKNYLVVGNGLIAEGGTDLWSAIPVKEGFQMSFIKAKPGNGSMPHNRDTNESFICLEGQWKVIWGGQGGAFCDAQQVRRLCHSALRYSALRMCRGGTWARRRAASIDSTGRQARGGIDLI